MAHEWISVEDKLPEFGTELLIWNEEGFEGACLVEKREDSIDDMGHDAGWIGMYAFPGRSFGTEAYKQNSHGQPSHWLSITPPDTGEN